MRKILAIEKNSWKNLWKVRNILSIACNVSLDKMPKEVKKERRVLTREEQEKFFTFASSYIHINVLKFAVTTGCRIGEVLGLKWEDCDFEKREITINKTILGHSTLAMTTDLYTHVSEEKKKEEVAELKILD